MDLKKPPPPPPPPLNTSPHPSSPAGLSTPSSLRNTRRKSALVNVVRRMNSSTPIERPPSDINQLVRIYLLDGSSKVLQVKESSTVYEVLQLLKYNLELSSVRDHAIYFISNDGGNNNSSSKRLELSERIKIYSEQCNSSNRLLFRSWIFNPYSKYSNEVMQYGSLVKQPTSALWLRWLEITMMLSLGYSFLSEEEALIAGAMKMQADSGDYSSSSHSSLTTLTNRIASTFPPPVNNKMKKLLQQNNASAAEELARKVQRIHKNLAGQSRPVAQINMLGFLSSVCPFFGSIPIPIDVQYDSNPDDATAEPPVLPMSLCFTPTALYLSSASSVLRQPYANILKHNTFSEHNILTYYIIKNSTDLSVVKYDTSSSSELLTKYCDCVYLVSPVVDEIAMLLEANMQISSNSSREPCLPNYEDSEDESEELENNLDKSTNNSVSSYTATATARTASSKNRRSSGFSLLLRALSLQAGDELESAHVDDDDATDNKADDVATHHRQCSDQYEDRTNSSVFRTMFTDQGTLDEAVAATDLSELTRAAEKDFMQEASSAGDDEASERSDSENSNKAAEPEKKSRFFKWGQI